MCDDGFGNCTFRAAIDEANANPGTDTIVFDIPGDGPHLIKPETALSTIMDPVIIDGYTQPGASPNTNGPRISSNAVLMIELNGDNAGEGANGLNIAAGDSIVRGLVINHFSSPTFGFSGVGIYLTAKGGNVIEGNFIGTDIKGTVDLSNWLGVVIDNAPNNIIGGTDNAARNIISGNNTLGIQINGIGATGNVVQGNFIGTDVTGTADLGNSMDGVYLFAGAAGNTIGGTTVGAGNLISGNDRYGVHISQIDTTNNLVQGNFIGTDVTGTADLCNSFLGVMLDVGTVGNTIGGRTIAAGNVISGNDQHGIVIDTFSRQNLIQGNFIGTDVTGTIALGNSFTGVRIVSPDNTVGGIGSGEGNTIAFNGGDGVSVNLETGNSILSNDIYSNGGLGIDLRDDGVTPNDGDGGIVGVINLQDFPVLSSAASDSAIIQGSLQSVPNNLFRIEFFVSSVCATFGHGEGERFLGAITVEIDGSGSASFTFNSPTMIDAGTVITATATGSDDGTSEFSPCILVG